MNRLLARASHRIANFLVLPLILAPLQCRCAAQLDGSFALSQATYLAGEPVFLSFTVKNVSKQAIKISAADPLSFCGNFHFEIAGVRDRQSMPCMGGGFGGSCLSSAIVLSPGKSHTDRILLNARFDLRTPGSYSLHVTHRLKYVPAGESLADLERSEAYQDFEFQEQILIQPSQADELTPDFVQYMHALDSADSNARFDAAEVIAYLAPKFMESAILKMLDTPSLQDYGVEGLRNLGTTSAHRALADFVTNSPPTDVVGPYQKALRYLGEIGDASDIPILLNVARANAPDSYNRGLAIESAGRAGGAEAVPSLVTELNDPSVDTQQATVRALYLTGSRAAVPVLIGLLRSPEWRVSQTAEFGLQVLTHRSGAKTYSMNPPPPDTYSKWVRWWRTDGQTATIFKSDQCGNILPLPAL